MIKVEASSQVIELRSPELAPINQIYSRMPVTLLDSEVRKTLPSFLDVFILDTHEYISQATISQENSDIVSSDQSINGWIAYVREEFYSVPEVEAIYVTIDENDVDIWLLIPNRDIGVVRQLAEREMNMLDRFATLERPQFLIEFHVVYRCDADESQYVPLRAIRLPR